MPRTKEQKKHLQRVIDWLKAGAPHVQLSKNHSLNGFDFISWIKPDDNSDCGTIACIAGAACEFDDADIGQKYGIDIEYDVQSKARRILGLDLQSCELLFYPFELLWDHPNLGTHAEEHSSEEFPLAWTEYLKPEQIAVVLQHFNDTDEINWNLVKPKIEAAD